MGSRYLLSNSATLWIPVVSHSRGSQTSTTVGNPLTPKGYSRFRQWMDGISIGKKYKDIKFCVENEACVVAWHKTREAATKN